MMMHPLTHKINFLLVDNANFYFPLPEKGNEKKYVK